jgi:hypothetical protein
MFQVNDYPRGRVVEGGYAIAQRRAEKPKNVKVSQKQQEVYRRLKSSKR